MKRILVHGLLFAAASVLIGACTNDEPKPEAYTYTQNFTGATSKTWQVQKAVAKKGTDVYDLGLQSCETDDLYVFYANPERLFEVHNGNNRCTFTDQPAEDDLLVSYSWGFTNSTATLNFVMPHIFGNAVVPAIVTRVSKAEMVVDVFANDEGTIYYEISFKAVSED
jgi:hypothetical protein